VNTAKPEFLQVKLQVSVLVSVAITTISVYAVTLRDRRRSFLAACRVWLEGEGPEKTRTLNLRLLSERRIGTCSTIKADRTASAKDSANEIQYSSRVTPRTMPAAWIRQRFPTRGSVVLCGTLLAVSAFTGLFSYPARAQQTDPHACGGAAGRAR